MQNEIDFYDQINELGDTIVDYVNGAGKLRYAVVTVDFSTPYVLEKMSPKLNEPLIDEAGRLMLFSWDADKPIRIHHSQVKKLTPLSAVLQNT